mgnify:CR=1 FL=1
MEIIIAPNYEAMSKTSAAIIAREVRRKHDLVLGLATGDTPIKNWGGAGVVDMGEASLNKLSTTTFDAKYNAKKYACAQCPLGCGANYKVTDGKWPVGDTDRPEYETLVGFGPNLMLNDQAHRMLAEHVNGGELVVPGPRVVLTARAFARALR